jgi:hypothetical protein
VLVGVNGLGLESTNAAMTTGRTLSWLQDVAGVDPWTSWGVTYRDVIIVDATGHKRGAFNLTTADLAQASNSDALEQQLLDARAP